MTTTTAANLSRGPVWVAKLFLISLLTPYAVSVGPIVLMPHRVVILLFFLPFFLRLFVLRKSGKPILIDWLMLGSCVWAALALIANHPFSLVVEPIGVHMIELFGAYLIARVSIRCVEDFQSFVRTFFIIVLVLFPFAAAESLTQRPILLNLLPGSDVSPVNAGVRMGMRRAQTVFAHPIHFGAFVSTGLGLFWFGLHPRGLRFLATPIVTASTVFSLSTGALISLVMQFAFVAWETILRTMEKRWTLFAALSVFGYILIDLLSNRSPFHVLVTYASFSSRSAYNRILIWQYGTDNIWDNPIFGLGLREWVRPPWMSASMDNFWLFIGVHYGLPSIAMLLGAIFLIVRLASRVKLHTEQENLCRAAYLVTIGGLIVAGGTVHYWHAMMAFVMFIFGTGIWTISGGTARQVDGEAHEAKVTPQRSRYTRQSGIKQRGGGRAAEPAARREVNGSRRHGTRVER
ncbi:MAG: O-antigen ligase family protein [Pseudomonadota bacterium]